MEQDLVSFVLRFVREAGEDQQARWRGMIKHVQSNTETGFTQFAEALAFMQGYVNEVVEASFEETQRMGQAFGEANPFMETARLWGDFMPRYTQMMMDSMGEAATGAGAQRMMKPMEEAMNATLAAWGMGRPAQQEQAAETLAAMSQQLTDLTAKVAELQKQIIESSKQTKEKSK